MSLSIWKLKPQWAVLLIHIKVSNRKNDREIEVLFLFFYLPANHSILFSLGYTSPFRHSLLATASPPQLMPHRPAPYLLMADLRDLLQDYRQPHQISTLEDFITRTPMILRELIEQIDYFMQSRTWCSDWSYILEEPELLEGFFT